MALPRWKLLRERCEFSKIMHHRRGGMWQSRGGNSCRNDVNFAKISNTAAAARGNPAVETATGTLQNFENIFNTDAAAHGTAAMETAARAIDVEKIFIIAAATAHARGRNCCRNAAHFQKIFNTAAAAHGTPAAETAPGQKRFSKNI